MKNRSRFKKIFFFSKIFFKIVISNIHYENFQKFQIFFYHPLIE
jgi:hypothetical protein